MQAKLQYLQQAWKTPGRLDIRCITIRKLMFQCTKIYLEQSKMKVSLRVIIELTKYLSPSNPRKIIFASMAQIVECCFTSSATWAKTWSPEWPMWNLHILFLTAQVSLASPVNPLQNQVEWLVNWPLQIATIVEMSGRILEFVWMRVDGGKGDNKWDE